MIIIFWYLVYTDRFLDESMVCHVRRINFSGMQLFKINEWNKIHFLSCWPIFLVLLYSFIAFTKRTQRPKPVFLIKLNKHWPRDFRTRSNCSFICGQPLQTALQQYYKEWDEMIIRTCMHRQYKKCYNHFFN